MSDGSGQAQIALAIIGAGGHARVVLDVALRIGMPIAGFLDREATLHGTLLSGHPILGGDERIDDFGSNLVLLANGVGVRPARGDPGTRLRARIHDSFVARGYRFPALVDPFAIIAGEVTVGVGSQVMAGAVVQPRCVLGVDLVINTRATIDHDCRIGDHAFIAPGAVLCGDVDVGAYAFVGAGAILLPGATVGAGAVVQAGAVLDRSVPDGGFCARLER